MKIINPASDILLFMYIHVGMSSRAFSIRNWLELRGEVWVRNMYLYQEFLSIWMIMVAFKGENGSPTLSPTTQKNQNETKMRTKNWVLFIKGRRLKLNKINNLKQIAFFFPWNDSFFFMFYCSSYLLHLVSWMCTRCWNRDYIKVKFLKICSSDYAFYQFK